MHRRCCRAHRGRAPIPWAIIRGLAKTGVTLFQIVDPTADSGPIVGQVEVPIAPDETATRRCRAAQRRPSGARPPPRAGAARRARRRTCRRTAARKRLAEADACRRDRRLGDARRVPRRLGARPDASLPGAFTFLGDEKVVVWRARPVELQAEARRPGTVRRRAARRASSCAAATARCWWRRPRWRRGAEGAAIGAAAWGRCSDEPRARRRRAPRRRGARHGRHDRPPRRRVGRRRAHRLRHRRSSSTQYPGDAERRAQKEGEAGARPSVLGVTDYVHLDLPDMRLDTLATSTSTAWSRST